MTIKSFPSFRLNPSNISIRAILKYQLDKPHHATFKSDNPHTPPPAKLSRRADPESADCSQLWDSSSADAAPSPPGPVEPLFAVTAERPDD